MLAQLPVERGKIHSGAIGSRTLHKVQLTRYDDDQDQDNDAGNDAHAHLHVLPPHLLADTVGAPTETLGRNGQVVCLVLQIVDSLATLVGHVDVVPHGVDGGLHGLWRRMMSAILHVHIENMKLVIRPLDASKPASENVRKAAGRIAVGGG